MEPISATIATALALGAAAALKDTATSAVKDAYAGLKQLVKDRYARHSVDALEENPGSRLKRDSVQEDLEGTQVDNDQEVLSKLNLLLRLISEHDPAAGTVIGVDVRDVTARALRISDVHSTGSGVRVSNAAVDGAIHIDGVRAGSAAEDPATKKA